MWPVLIVDQRFIYFYISLIVVKPILNILVCRSVTGREQQSMFFLLTLMHHICFSADNMQIFIFLHDLIILISCATICQDLSLLGACHCPVVFKRLLNIGQPVPARIKNGKRTFWLLSRNKKPCTFFLFGVCVYVSEYMPASHEYVCMHICMC